MGDRPGTTEPHLSVLSAPGLAAWSLHDRDTGACLAFHVMADDEGFDDPRIPKDPRSVSFITLPEWSTLVPGSTLAPGSEAAHLALVHGGLPEGALRDEPVPQLSATCVHVHDDRAEHQLLTRFPSARPLALQALLVRMALTRCVEGPALVLHRGQDRLDVALAKNGNLLVSNTFPARTATDVLYFSLLALQGHGLHADQVEMHLGGIALAKAEQNLLDKYFARPHPALPSPHGPELRGPVKEPQRWMALLEQYACVS